MVQKWCLVSALLWGTAFSRGDLGDIPWPLWELLLLPLKSCPCSAWGMGLAVSPTPPLPTAPGDTLGHDVPPDKTGAPHGQTHTGMIAEQPRAQSTRNASLTVVPGWGLFMWHPAVQTFLFQAAGVKQNCSVEPLPVSCILINGGCWFGSLLPP